MSVLVTHGHNRLAYYATRCLAKHDIKVTSASEFPLAATFFSKYCTDHFTYPSPWKQPDQFVQKMIEEIERRDIDVLMPVHREGYVLAKYKDELDDHVEFPYSPYSKIVSVNDKKTMIDVAEKAGVRTPKTIAPSNLDQVKETESTLQFPVLIKLRRSYGGIGMSQVNSQSRFTETYLKTVQRFRLSTGEYPIIQEMIRGTSASIEMLLDQGKLVAEHGIGKTRYYARYGYEDPEAIESLHRLGKHLNWHGMLSASLVIEKDTKTTYFTDINPRFSGALGHAILSGVELPYLLCQIAVDRNVKPVTHHNRDMKARYLWGDLSHIPKYIRSQDWEQVLDIITSRSKLDFWDKSDPAPFFTIPAYHLSLLIQYGTMQPLIEKY